MLEPDPAVLACSYKTAGRVEHICTSEVCDATVDSSASAVSAWFCKSLGALLSKYVNYWSKPAQR